MRQAGGSWPRCRHRWRHWRRSCGAGRACCWRTSSRRRPSPPRPRLRPACARSCCSRRAARASQGHEGPVRTASAHAPHAAGVKHGAATAVCSDAREWCRKSPGVLQPCAPVHLMLQLVSALQSSAGQHALPGVCTTQRLHQACTCGMCCLMWLGLRWERPASLECACCVCPVRAVAQVAEWRALRARLGLLQDARGDAAAEAVAAQQGMSPAQLAALVRRCALRYEAKRTDPGACCQDPHARAGCFQCVRHLFCCLPADAS